MTKTYNELQHLETFEERFRYLALRGDVGFSTFGFDRYLNQNFYSSREWRRIRRHVILRDEAFDLGIAGYEIHNRLLIHHMNPITEEELIHGDANVVDPEFLITTCHQTHNAIHYGDESLLPRPFVPRRYGDTKLW